MDTKLYVSILRDHSEHLRKLSTELSEKLSHLEQALTQEKNPSETNTKNPLEGAAQLNDSLFSAADMLHRRLHRLLTDIEADAVSRGS
jgi:hypothetical protein